MVQDQLIGWILVAALVSVGIWTSVALYVNSLCKQLSLERLRNASLRERLEPCQPYRSWAGNESASKASRSAALDPAVRRFVFFD